MTPRTRNGPEPNTVGSGRKSPRGSAPGAQAGDVRSAASDRARPMSGDYQHGNYSGRARADRLRSSQSTKPFLSGYRPRNLPLAIMAPRRMWLLGSSGYRQRGCRDDRQSPPEEAAHSGPTGDPVPYVLDPNTGFLIPYAVNRNTGNLTPYVPAEGINLFVPGYTAPYILRGGIPQVFIAQHSADIPDVNTSEEELDYSKLLHSFFPDTIPDDRFLSSDDAARYFAEFIRDILNTQASSLELANLAGQLEKVKSNEDAQGATDRIANETPFTNVAKKIHEVNHKHGPGWGSYIAGLAVPIVLQLSGWLGQTQPPAPPPEPIPISVIYEGAPTVPGPCAGSCIYRL
jgi:hypothetical protein